MKRNSWMIGQGHNEAIVRAHLAKYGIEAELNTELVDFEQTADGVIAHLVKHNGAEEVKETFRAEYSVGAEGAHSKYTAYRFKFTLLTYRNLRCDTQDSRVHI